MELLQPQINLFSDEPERQFTGKIAYDHRKHLGQFFTPYSIAKLMAGWVAGHSRRLNILDPAFGLGIFARAIFENFDNVSITGFEIDDKVLTQAKTLFRGFEKKLKLFKQDYIFAENWNEQYDGIICNPPYLKFHDYENSKYINHFNQKTKASLTGFTNLYPLFILKAIGQLKKGGRAAFIVPSEFLNADYGKEVKKQLLESQTLRHVLIIDFKENVFDEALTTASILLFANDGLKENIEFVTIKNIGELTTTFKTLTDYPNTISIGKLFPTTEIEPDKKWRKYYHGIKSNRYKNLIPLSDFGKAMRGIATGANDYFTFNKEKQEKFEIDSSFLTPCISKASDVKSPFFTKHHLQSLIKEGKKAFLLDVRRGQVEKNDKLKAYIELGEKQDYHQRYLTKKRNPWFIAENRPPAPIWVSVFNRNGLKFIRNEAMIKNLTTFHCIYLNNLFASGKTDLFFAYLLTDISKEIFNDNRREYGNGLKKFEPNDLNNALIADLNAIKEDVISDILIILNQYRESVLSGCEDREKLFELDRLFRFQLT